MPLQEIEGTHLTRISTGNDVEEEETRLSSMTTSAASTSTDDASRSTMKPFEHESTQHRVHLRRLEENNRDNLSGEQAIHHRRGLGEPTKKRKRESDEDLDRCRGFRFSTRTVITDKENLSLVREIHRRR